MRRAPEILLYYCIAVPTPESRYFAREIFLQYAQCNGDETALNDCFGYNFLDLSSNGCIGDLTFLDVECSKYIFGT